MASGQAWYGSLKPQYFILVDSAGARVVNHAFVATDIYLIDTGQGGGDDDLVAGTSEIAHVSKGVYKWTPTAAAQTQVETIVVTMTDSAGSAFIDNAMIIQTGGHASAYFDAGL